MKKLRLLFCTFAVVVGSFQFSKNAQADELRYIPSGEAALMEMAQAIKSARHTIDLTYYILEPCSPSGRVFLNLLSQKAKQGVRVRIIVDAFTHKYETRTRLTAYLRQHGIQLRYFNPRAEFNPKQTFRSHVKLLLVDSNEYISGGRNIAPDYFSMADGLNFVDRDVHVRGNSAIEAQDSFDRLWNSPFTYADPARHTIFLDRFVKSCLPWGAEETKLLDIINTHAEDVVNSRRTVSCSNVDFVMDDATFASYQSGLPLDSYMTPDKLKKKHTTRELLDLIDNTKSVLTLENWSYDPWGAMRTSIDDLRDRHVGIFVITNKVTDVGGSMDYRNTVGVGRDSWGSQYIRTLSYKGSMRDSWSETPENSFFMIHSKVFISDDKTTAVTSYNIDARSYHYNLESAVIARNCPAFAQEVLATFAKLNANFEKDESCKECQRQPTFKFFDRLKAILGASYY